MSGSLLYVLALQCALAGVATAQTDRSTGSEPPRPCSGGLTTVGECLMEHQIPLTKDGLRAALHSEDTEIWQLAAEELAIEGMKDAIPDLAGLLELKSEPIQRIILANSLAQLGDERGVQTLQAYCDDKTAQMGDRLSAANHLLRYRPKSCPETLIEGLQDNVYRGQALGMIPNFKELSPSESAQVRAFLLKSLSDQDFVNRLQAAQTIEGLGDVFAIPALEAALARESQPQVRGAM